MKQTVRIKLNLPLFNPLRKWLFQCFALLLLLSSVVAFREPAPPQHEDLVGNARWMVKYSNVTIVSTHSSFLEGYPFSQNKDVADGLYNETLSWGIPIVYVSPMATLTHDFVKDARVTFTYSAEFTHYCKDQGIDNDSPRCGKVMLSGLMEKVRDIDEVAWAKYGIFARHPDTKDWPISHGFAFYKLNIKNVYVIDYFGGATKHLNVTEYLNYTPSWM